MKERIEKIVEYVGKTMVFLLTFLVVAFLTVFLILDMICDEKTSPAAKKVFVSTVLETGQLKFLASCFLSDEEISEVVNENSMRQLNDEVDSSLINISHYDDGVIEGEVVASYVESENADEIEIIEIPGATFYATLMIVKDPTRVSVATIYPFREQGVSLDVLVETNGAIAGINGGLYKSYNNSGGSPYGVVVSEGRILYNEPQEFEGLVLIGLTEENILDITDINGFSKEDVEKLVKNKKIRDAVTFQEEATDKNNHFVQLIINGKKREMNGMGSGLNPRTAIGQRSDGALLLLVTDGRGKNGHLGASASDLMNIMSEYGAVNACNLDGGSSSCMYYGGEYLMTSVTFYYDNSSWRLPLGFVVK